jgi:homoserine kinase
MSGIKVFAPASIGNLAVGFDILGCCLDRPGDEIVAKISKNPGVTITKITGAGGKLATDPTKNTASVAAQALLDFLGEKTRGIEMEIHKKMPLGSGLGSSAASAVAGVFVASELLKTGLSKRELLPFAAAGEAVASGGIHLDNVAPSMLGGLILVRDNATADVHRLQVPKGLMLVVVHPQLQILTKDARAILSSEISLKTHIQQSANLGAFLLGLYNSDIDLIARSLRDDVIEPQRARLIPNFYEIKEAALSVGALGCSISGAGPSMFALCKNSVEAEDAGRAMQAVFAKNKIASTVYLSKINQEGVFVV